MFFKVETVLYCPSARTGGLWSYSALRVVVVAKYYPFKGNNPSPLGLSVPYVCVVSILPALCISRERRTLHWF